MSTPVAVVLGSQSDWETMKEACDALTQFGIEVAERVPHAFPTNEHNAFYLTTKAKKSGHIL